MVSVKFCNYWTYYICRFYERYCLLSEKCYLPQMQSEILLLVCPYMFLILKGLVHVT